MNLLFQLVTSIALGAISFATSLFIARQVGASHFGEYSIALAIGSILAIAFDGGLRNLLVRERTRASIQLNTLHDELANIAMGHSLIAAMIASIICLVIFPDQLLFGLGIIWCFWGVVITQYGSAILRGDGHLKKDLLWQLKQRIATASLIILTVILGNHEAWNILLAWLMGALYANLFFKEGFRFKPLFKALYFKNFKLYQTLFPLFWIDIATTIYFRSDLILLRYLNVSDNDIGQYAAAFRIIEGVILIASPISIIIFRKIRLLHEEPSLQSNYIVKSLLIGTFLGFLTLVLIQLAAKTLIQISFGHDYNQAATLLPILGLMIALLIPNIILTQSALALNLEKPYALTATLAAICNIGLNFIFIPKYGTKAAAFTSITAEFVLLIGLSYAIYSKMKFCRRSLRS